MPVTGFVDAISRLSVAGWAADTDDPDGIVEISVERNGGEEARAPAGKPREDLRRLGKYGAGNHGFTITFDPPLSHREVHHILVRELASQQVLEGGELIIQARDLGDAFGSLFESPKPVPGAVLVTCHGRSGTTLLMKRLRGHPQIAVAGPPPYEIKLATYYAGALEVLTLPGDWEKSSRPDGLGRDPFYIGRNPFFTASTAAGIDADLMYTFFYSKSRQHLAGSFREIIAGFYGLASRELGRGPPAYFAEKCDVFGAARAVAREMFPKVREIVLIRDMRDVLCSSHAFFEPGSVTPSSLGEYAERFVHLQREAKEDVIFVRYEDLVSDEGTTLARIAAHLELERSFEPTELANDKLFARHATSASVEASIGRWRRELSPQQQRLCADIFGDFLRQFGYGEN
jgi:hypothetical protein